VWHPHKTRAEVRLLPQGGRAAEPQTAERRRHLARRILHKGAPQALGPPAAQGRVVDAWPYGPLSVVDALWQRLGLAESITEPRTGRTLAVPVARARFAMGAIRREVKQGLVLLALGLHGLLRGILLGQFLL
jgi:hypothetical protein